MQPSSTTHYPDWKAPSEDGQVIVWPKPADLVQQIHDNLKLLSTSTVRVQGIPLAEVRQRMRQFIGHENSNQPLVAAGHQTELYHAGVWAKNALIDETARRVDGKAFLIAVDTDAPKHLNFRWPPGE